MATYSLKEMGKSFWKAGKKEFEGKGIYSEVPNRRADWNKRAGLEKNSTLPAFLLSKLINEQGGIFCLLHKKL